MILSAQTLRKLQPLRPFVERTVYDGLSYGLSAASYDVRLDKPVKLNPHSFALGSTYEFFSLPDNVSARVMDKSTWARRGLSLFNTYIDPGFKGYLTLEMTNNSMHKIVISAGTPIAQIVFEFLDEATEMPYKGKYQNQERGPQAARYEDEVSARPTNDSIAKCIQDGVPDDTSLDVLDDEFDLIRS